MISSYGAATDRFLSSMRDLNTRLERAQARVASGKKLVSPSDGPDSVSTLLQTRTDLSHLAQLQSNLNRLNTEVGSADQAIQNAIQLMDNARTLAMTGASGFQSQETRNGIADQLLSVEQRMLGIANTQVDGRYIFSGDTDSVAPFGIDMTQSPPYGPYQGTVSTRQALNPTGVTFPTGLDGETVFANQDPAKNVLAGLEAMRQALLSGDQTAMNKALAPLAGLSTHLNTMLTWYGNVENQITEATKTATTLTLRLNTEKSNLEDADLTESIVELQQLKYTQAAALEVRGKLPKTTLFDYLG